MIEKFALLFFHVYLLRGNTDLMIQIISFDY